MTEQHAQRSANPVAQYGKRERAPMGRAATPDPLRDPRRIWYVDNVKDFENDETLWWSAVRGHAYNWLKDHNCVQSINRTEIVQGCQKLTSNRTLAGFREYMSNVERSLEALNEETAAVQQRPLLSHADMFEAAAKKHNTDPNLYLGARREALAAHGIGADQSLYQESYETFCAANSRPVVKSTSPFGRLGLPAEMVEKARIRGEELRAEREKKEAEMAQKTNSEAIAEFNAANEPDAAPWTKTPGLLSKFWENVFSTNAIFNKQETAARALVIEKLGTDPATWPTIDECYAIADTALGGFHQAKIDAQKPVIENAPKSGAVENERASEPTNTVPAKIDAESAPNLHIVEKADNPMAEAAFVVLFSLYGPHGAELKFTVRAMTVDELDTRIEALTAKFMSKGYKAERASATMPAPVTQAIAPAPTNGVAPAPGAVAAPAATPATSGGTVNVQAIKKVMDEGKVRYELFTSLQDEKPALTVRLDSIVQSVIAPHIDVNALQPGTRYQVNWLVDWKNGKLNPKNNLYYRDVAAIRPAAA